MKEIIAAFNHGSFEGVADIEALNAFNRKIIDAGGDSMIKLGVMDGLACSTETDNGTTYCTILVGFSNQKYTIIPNINKKNVRSLGRGVRAVYKF